MAEPYWQTELNAALLAKENDMKKLVYLAFVVLFVIGLGACTMVQPEPVKGVIKPGDQIGAMTVEQSTEIPYQNIWRFCDSMPIVRNSNCIFR